MTSDKIDDLIRQLCGDIDPRFDSVARNERCMAAMRRSIAGDAVCITLIRTDSGYHGQGYASELLTSICNAADNLGVTLLLDVERQDASEMAGQELADWYWRYGFRGVPSEMLREPCSLQ